MIIGLSVTKSVSFRLVQQEFTNVYHYSLPGAVTGPWQSLLEEVKASEVGFHATDVSFIRGAVWSAGGSPAQNQMLFQESLSGTGNQAVNSTMDRERAVLIRWFAGFASNGKPVYLRKWYHCCGNFAGNTLAGTVIQNTGQISSAGRASIASAASAMNQIGAVEAWDLCSASGRLWQAQPDCHPYLEHHQLGDMWR